MKNLSDIVNVSISLSEPLVDSASFDNMLIVGPEPKSWRGLTDEQRAKKDTVYICSSLSEVTEKGGLEADTDDETGDAIGQAARVAFSQDPKPTKVYFAVNKKLTETLKNCKVTVIKNASELPEGLSSEDDDFSEIKNSFPWVVASAEFGVDVDDDLRETNVVMRRGTGEIDDFVSCSVGNVNYIIFALGGSEGVINQDTDEPVNCTLIVEDKIYKSAEKVEVENAMSVSYDFEAERTGGTVSVDPNSTRIHFDYSYEDINETLNRALLVNGWYVVCPAYLDKTMIKKIGSWVDAQTKLMIYPETDIPEEFNGTAEGLAYSLRCAGIFCKQSIDQETENIPCNNKYIHVAWAAKCLNYIAGSETWALKTLVGIAPSSLSTNQMTKLENANLSYYVTCADRNITYNGKVTYGEWIDVIRFRDWLQNDMQKAIYSLMLKNSKIPYTDEGIALVKSEMIASLKRGQKNGGIAGTEYNDDDEEIPGFIVTVPRSANITDSQKKSRVLTDCKFTARLAGAIHVVDIRGTLAYSL